MCLLSWIALYSVGVFSYNKDIVKLEVLLVDEEEDDRRRIRGNHRVGDNMDDVS